ncbi:uncharacterized protein B0I36DRAFT_349265 [Microdochium trichocladiopsis]|uniref:Uncharacterized protein n=1 Tax=Microdochium trichocladiopsis TaxID=1682393 RepID=A0A9P8Y8Y5_9PEZI|nr:uncharacterized protein B0I36DRAFT_349265 [Microdochium trichocladiopsis]KAH7031146.1 hypothetical protein B0I36DRAFT_349265 [Microdochium trichocladiopsis]
MTVASFSVMMDNVQGQERALADPALDPQWLPGAPVPLTGHTERFRGDPEASRELRGHFRMLDELAREMPTTHRPGSWAFCIVRLTYAADAQFERSLARVDAALADYAHYEAEMTGFKKARLGARLGITIPDHTDPRRPARGFLAQRGTRTTSCRTKRISNNATGEPACAFFDH